MPVILHALWLPHTITSSGDLLALWAESSAPRRVRYPYDNSYSQHSLSLYNTLAGLGFYYSRNYFGQPHYLRLALPSNDRRPLPSVTSPDKPAARKRKRAEPALRAWRVEAALLTPAHALSLLLRLPSETTPATIGPSLRFWEQAARLACAAILRGQFVPYADDDGRGFWQLAFADAELQTDFARLAEAMPPSARALAQPLPSSRDLLAQFIGALGSQFLSQVYAPGRSPFYDPYKYQRRPTEQRPADQWWIDLFPRKDYGANFFSKKANAEAMKALGETVRAWSLPSRKYLASRHRVAFRLEPPPTVEAFDPSLADWRLSFHLQPKDQPETLWAASEVWENPPQPDMPDVLRAGLAQAASLYPPLTGANDDDYPTGLWLNVEQAFEFLEKHSAELNGRGFGVLIPTWWKNRAAKLSTRVSLGRWGDGSGLFGMDSLVNFDWQLAIGDKALALEEFMQLAQSKTSLVQVKGEW
ncbi:MAG: SNF2 helicase-associated domain-containing protein, partial [Chloroflexi bacterium]|nr:SNF2 helicase-associated domain-containing protein [Chloroflexota bacterium]